MNKSKTPTRKRNGLKARAGVSRKTVTSARVRSGNGTGHTNGHPRNGEGNGVSGENRAAGLSAQELLLRDREQVRSELSRLREELLIAPEATGDEVDLSVYDREKTLGLIKAFELRLEKLENAIRRTAQSGEYGICQQCGKPIDAERLKIFPETRHCVKCKTAIEQQAKRMMQVK